MWLFFVFFYREGREVLPLPSNQVLGSSWVLLIKVRVVYEMANWHLSPWPVTCKNFRILESSGLFPSPIWAFSWEKLMGRAPNLEQSVIITHLCCSSGENWKNKTKQLSRSAFDCRARKGGVSSLSGCTFIVVPWNHADPIQEGCLLSKPESQWWWL